MTARKRYLEKIIPAGVAAAILLLGLLCAGTASALVLITPEEALLPDAPAPPAGTGPDGELKLIVPESTAEGPEIVVMSPEQGKDYRSPLKVFVRFVPREGTEVKLSTLKVEFIKIFTIDITDRLREYAKSEGIFVEKAEIPSGSHKVRVTVGDSDGGMTSRAFVLKVR